MRPRVRLALVVALLGAAAATAQPQAFGISYSTVTDLLAGRLWEVAFPWDLSTALQGTPADWPIMGVGTTNREEANGEVLITGTAGQPQVLWCDPEYPQAVWPVTEAMPFVAFVAGDPGTAITVPAQPGGDLVAQVRQACESRHLGAAGVLVQGRLHDVGGTIAYHLTRAGAPLSDYNVNSASYLYPFSAPEPSAWQVVGVWTTAPQLQGVMGLAGHPLHLHGARSDLTRGGHLSRAIVDDATIRLYPFDRFVQVHADVAVRDGVRQNGGVQFVVTNLGAATAVHVVVAGMVNNQPVFRFQLGNLQPNERRVITLPVTWPQVNTPLTVIADPDNQLRDPERRNNQLVF